MRCSYVASLSLGSQVLIFGGPFIGDQKWEGGVEFCGTLYCMPQNADDILAINADWAASVAICREELVAEGQN